VILFCLGIVCLQLDWSEFSIHLAEKDIPDLHNILGNITEEKFAQMQVGGPAVH
jgi:hypothetical protein